MKIKTLRNVLIKGKHYPPGKTVQVNDKDGKYLVAIGKAESLEKKETAEDPEAKGRETR